MKKLLFTTVAILMLGMFNQASAQFGARAGLNISNVSFADEDEAFFDSKIGFHAGVFYEHRLNEALYIRPAALFSLKGAKAEEEFAGVTISQSVNISYVEVPIDVVYKIAAGGNSININAGPYIGMLLSANTKFDDGSGNSEEEDVKDMLKGIDFGLNLGVEYQMNQLGIGAGYGLGLSNIDDSGFDDTVKNKNITFYVAYRF